MTNSVVSFEKRRKNEANWAVIEWTKTSKKNLKKQNRCNGTEQNSATWPHIYTIIWFTFPTKSIQHTVGTGIAQFQTMSVYRTCDLAIYWNIVNSFSALWFEATGNLWSGWPPTKFYFLLVVHNFIMLCGFEFCGVDIQINNTVVKNVEIRTIRLVGSDHKSRD